MSKSIGEHTMKHGRTFLLVVAAVSVAVIGGYVAYPYSSAEQVMLAKIGRAAAATGLSQVFVWTNADK